MPLRAIDAICIGATAGDRCHCGRSMPFALVPLRAIGATGVRWHQGRPRRRRGRPSEPPAPRPQELAAREGVSAWTGGLGLLMTDAVQASPARRAALTCVHPPGFPPPIRASPPRPASLPGAWGGPGPLVRLSCRVVAAANHEVSVPSALTRRSVAPKVLDGPFENRCRACRRSDGSSVRSYHRRLA